MLVDYSVLHWGITGTRGKARKEEQVEQRSIKPPIQPTINSIACIVYITFNSTTNDKIVLKKAVCQYDVFSSSVLSVISCLENEPCPLLCSASVILSILPPFPSLPSYLRCKLQEHFGQNTKSTKKTITGEMPDEKNSIDRHPATTTPILYQVRYTRIYSRVQSATGATGTYVSVSRRGKQGRAERW